jgi:hypothetical protein
VLNDRVEDTSMIGGCGGIEGGRAARSELDDELAKGDITRQSCGSQAHKQASFCLPTERKQKSHRP